MNLVHKLLEVLKHLGVLPQPLAPEGVAQRGDAGDDQTHVVLGTLQEEGRRLLIKLTAGELKLAEERSAAHGTEDDAVFDFHVADLPRGEQGFVLRVDGLHGEISFLIP